jgi:hypothetical protein
MTGLKRYLGIDFVDLLIQAGITGMLLAFVGISDGPEEIMPMLVAGSLVVLGIRRHRAFKGESVGLTTGQMAAARLEELEERVGQLEAAENRLAELEERVEFAERLLAQASGERALPVDRAR